jgi:hypothetical protein
MVKRSSVDKANWSLTREQWYQKECDKILFDNESNIRVNDSDVYLRSTDKEELFLQITKPKTTWYEIWLKLKNIY